MRSYEMTFSHETADFGIFFLDRHYLTVYPACKTAGTFNVQLHNSEELNTLTVKCFRRRV